MTVKSYRIEKDTPILPWVVSDSVVEELILYFHDRNETSTATTLSSQKLELADYLTAYAQAAYQRSEKVRKEVKAEGSKGRDWLYSFMRHWLSARIAELHQDIFKQIPNDFKLGRQLQRGVQRA